MINKNVYEVKVTNTQVHHNHNVNKSSFVLRCDKKNLNALFCLPNIAWINAVSRPGHHKQTTTVECDSL